MCPDIHSILCGRTQVASDVTLRFHLAVTECLIALQTTMLLSTWALSSGDSVRAAHPLACSFSRMDSASTAMQDTIS